MLDLAETGVQCCNVHTNHVSNWRERYSLAHCCLFVCNPTCCCRPVVILAIWHHLTVHLWVEWCCNSSFSLVKRNLCWCVQDPNFQLFLWQNCLLPFWECPDVAVSSLFKGTPFVRLHSPLGLWNAFFLSCLIQSYATILRIREEKKNPDALR